MAEMVVRGAPRIILPHEIFERCVGWMNATEEEVSWRGLADWNEKDFLVKEVFLPIQKAGVAEVHVPTAKEGGDFGKWLSDCIRRRAYENSQGECRYKLHMHKHPGISYFSLGESVIDENNTAKFGLKDVEWMMVGRGVSSGKFQIDLEVFAPFRVNISHLPVFVEYRGALFQVSEPGQEPRIEELEVQIKDTSALLSLKEGESAYSGDVKVIVREEAWIIPTVTTRGICYYPRGSKKQERKKLVTALQASSWVKTSERVRHKIFVSVGQHHGVFFSQLRFNVGPWSMKTDPVAVNVDLPQLPDVRAEAAEQIAKKLTVIVLPMVTRYTPVAYSSRSSRRIARRGAPPLNH